MSILGLPSWVPQEVVHQLSPERVAWILRHPAPLSLIYELQDQAMKQGKIPVLKAYMALEEAVSDFMNSFEFMVEQVEHFGYEEDLR